jgi:hypothetical protein
MAYAWQNTASGTIQVYARWNSVLDRVEDNNHSLRSLNAFTWHVVKDQHIATVTQVPYYE